MTYSFDPELMDVIKQMAAAGAATPIAGRDDWRALRATSEAGLQYMESQLPAHATVQRRDFLAKSADGTAVPVRLYTNDGSSPGSAFVYLHGGGMILGSIELYDRVVAGYVEASGVPLLSVDYRLAPEAPHPGPVEDAYAGLTWLVDNAAEFDIDPARVGLMGDSGGGGLAAGAALLARERGITVAKQILIYPMLDDRNTTPDPTLAPFAGWSYDNNYTGWHALLGELVGGEDVPSVAAPARAGNLSGLPSTYVEVGELDIFRDQSIEYARRIALTGTSIELHVHPGVPHGFERVIPHSRVGTRSQDDRIRAIQSI